MRLINTVSYELKTFYPPNVPPYAILSHVWGKKSDEVSFDDMIDPSLREAKGKPGWAKITGFCEQAKSDGFEWAWVDTCCINKSDLSELSTSLNSMFTWYRESGVCYAYLSDVADTAVNHAADDSQFRKCKWFTRGWTLQELIAPQFVHFYNADWKEIGTKASLRVAISEITGIERSVLVVRRSGEVSIAQRMSWAAGRETSRVEDRAYSLLGILGVHMVTNYGEGENAFRRLQLEIMKLSNDHSLFAWKGKSSGNSFLAGSPADFAHAASIRPMNPDKDQDSYAMTNNGLDIKLPIAFDQTKGLYHALLNCRDTKRETKMRLGIYVEKIEGTENRFVRTKTIELVHERDDLKYEKQTLFIKQKDPSRFELHDWMRREKSYRMVIPSPVWRQGEQIKLVARDPSESEQESVGKWAPLEDGSETFSMSDTGSSGLLLFEDTASGKRFAVVLGIHRWTPWCHIITEFEEGEGMDSAASLRDSFHRSGGKRTGIVWAAKDQSTGGIGNKSLYVAVRPQAQDRKGKDPVSVYRVTLELGTDGPLLA